MKEIGVIKLLRLLGYSDSEMVVREGWVNVTCPLASMKHPSGRDTHASAGISINNEGQSVFKCFSCTPDAVPLLSLVVQRAYDGVSYYDYEISRFFQENEIYSGEDTEDDILLPQTTETMFGFNKWAHKKKTEKELPAKFPDKLLEFFPLIKDANDNTALHIKNYLMNVRKISLSTAVEMGVRYNKDKNLIIFPLTDRKGNIQVLRARLCDVASKVMYTISAKHFNNKFELPTIRDTGASFGLHLLESSKPTIVVESETDCLLLKSYGFNNVIATTTASFSRAQVVNIMSSSIWVGFDSDDAGKRAAKKLAHDSNTKLIYIIDWADAGGKDPGDAANRIDIARAIRKKRFIDKKSLTKYKKYVMK
jgi:hypothetical protein